jgi:ankyrin repeat protein
MLRNVTFLLSVGLLGAATALAQGDTRLPDAAERGDRDAVRSLLMENADVNAAQGDGSTALHWAAYKDDLQMAKLLLDAHAGVQAATRVGSITPLFMASKNGSAAMIELLLQSGANPSSANERGTTALMTAASSGSADAVRVLVEHGAEVNARDAAHGQTALMFAADLNRADVIKVLLAHGADPKIQTKAMKLPKAPARMDDNPEPDKKEAPKKDPPAGNPGEPASRDVKQLNETVQKLASRVDAMEKKLPGSQPATADGNGIASERGTTDIGGMTALLFAAREGQIEAARALLQGGADVNQVSGSERTSPLVLAIQNGHYDLGKFLLDYGADPNLANSQGLTALYATIDVMWAPKGWFPEPITAQENITYLKLMKALLEDGANPNARLTKKLWFRSFGDHSWIDTAGSTAYLRAAQSSDVEAMKLLVEHGADPDIPTLGGATPLMVAAGIGWGYHYSMNVPNAWMDTVKYCVEHGADVNAADSRGYTALHGAAYLGNHEMIAYLMDHGADVKAVAKDKNTVADMANGPTRFGIPHPETVALLEKLGSANSHNCRSDQCLVNPRDEKKPAAAPAPVAPTPPATTAKKPGENLQ